MTTSDIYSLAKYLNVPIFEFNLSPAKSVSIIDDNYNCFIAIDNATEFRDDELNVLLTHELGHCETGAFYNKYSAFNIISKNEYKANRWAVKTIIPYDELRNALSDGIVERWELAEYFNVTEKFIDITFEQYRAMGYFFNEDDL